MKMTYMTNGVLEERSGMKRQARSLSRTDAILDAAHALMAEKGYTAMTMDDLAAHAGITKPTLYRYFPSKEAIAIQSLVRLMRQNRIYFQSIDPTLPAIERVHEVVRWSLHVKFIQRRAALGTAREILNPLIRAHTDYQSEFSQIVTLLSDMLEAGKREGSVSPALNTRVAVQTFFSVMRDWEYDELIRSGTVPPEEIFETLLATLVNGVRTVPG